MGYDVSLRNIEDENEVFEVEPHREGSLVTLGGSTTAEMTVTYNYLEVTHLVGFHFRDDLDGKVAKDTIPILEKVVEKLGTHRYKDYWAPTPGNTGAIANTLLSWAKQHPHGVWEVS